VSLTNLSTIKGMWSNKVLCVALAPEQVTLIVRRGKEVMPETAVGIPLPHSEGRWQEAVAALRTWLRTSGESVAGLPISVSISNRWCHLMMLPWSDALLTQTDARRFAQSQFVATFGDAAHGWRYTLDDTPHRQTRLACAMEGDLLDALNSLAEQSGHRLIAVESALSIAGRALGQHRPLAFALQERGRVVLAQVDKGRIVGVQAQPCQGNWVNELSQAWQRWTLRSPELSHIASVALVRLDDTPANGPLDEVFNAVRLPSHTLAPGFAAVCMMEA
jgi:hypothetical protein